MRTPCCRISDLYSAGFLADPAVEAADSCAFDDSGFLGGIWTERQGVLRVLADARRGGSLEHGVLAAAERCYLAVRTLAKRGYHAARAARKRRARPPRPEDGAGG
jgi:hypothetical protein